MTLTRGSTICARRPSIVRPSKLAYNVRISRELDGSQRLDELVRQDPSWYAVHTVLYWVRYNRTSFL
jgi:hypothetical protein